MPVSVSTARTAWLMMAAGDNRQHGGNDGYDDEVDIHYSWDSTVGNHAAVSIGDPIVLWDKESLLGVSVVEEIVVGNAEKVLYRCPNCERAAIKRRRIASPAFRCDGCETEFEYPAVRISPVTTYRTRHDAGWVDLRGVLSGKELRDLCASPKSQQSIRRIRWGAFLEAVVAAKPSAELRFVYARGARLSGGHRTATVRVRLGQTRFRQRLLATFGPICAFAGPSPAEVLEAAHLYSYAELGQHHEHGGVLLRRDIHRLFDSGLLAVAPDTLKIHVSPELSGFVSYKMLEGEPISVGLSAEHLRWFRAHFEQHFC